MVIYDFVEMSVRCYMRNKITLFFFPAKIFKKISVKKNIAGRRSDRHPALYVDD